MQLRDQTTIAKRAPESGHYGPHQTHGESLRNLQRGDGRGTKKMSTTKKFIPIKDKEYIITDQCFWQGLTEEEKKQYNPYDKKRAPHGVQLVDPDTGTIVNLLSGSIIKIVKSK